MTKKKVDGLEKAMATLRIKLNALGTAGLRGLVRAALLIRRDAMKGCPVVTGNLRASAFIVSGSSQVGGGTINAGGGTSFKGKSAGKVSSSHAVALAKAQALASGNKNPFAYVGFGAFYAPYVHESTGAGTGVHKKGVPAYKQKSSVGGPKFLENAVRSNMGKIIELVAQDIKRKVGGVGGKG